MPNMLEVTTISDIESLRQFSAAIQKLGGKISHKTVKDFLHMRRIRWLSWFAAGVGYATAWLPNPFSVLLIAQHNIVDFMMGHHACHGAYNKISGVNTRRYRSDVFGKGWRRYRDWLTWWEPEWWMHAHNSCHHKHIQDPLDLDLISPETFKVVPKFFRYLAVAFYSCTWPFMYYAPYIQREFLRRGKSRSEAIAFKPLAHVFNFFDPIVRSLWLKQYLPVILIKFIALPSMFLVISPGAALTALATMLGAEIINNIQGFICHRSSHYGIDIPQFTNTVNGRTDYIVRQVVGSTNYKSFNDFTHVLHGYNMFHIEHHLWPSATMLQLKNYQPEVAKLCKQYGLPYHNELVFKRLKKSLDIYISGAQQPMMSTVALQAQH